MKKLWLTLGLAFIGATCLAAGVACDKGNDTDDGGPKTYVVTFVQEGYAPISKPVAEGGSLSDANIPVPQDKTGYTVTWGITDGLLTNIQSNITVNAVFTANEYLVTFDLQTDETWQNGNDGEYLAGYQVTYDSAYTLPTPQKDGYVFQYWLYGAENKSIPTTGEKWQIADDIEVTAEWTEDIPDYCEITFVYDADTKAVKQVAYGEDLSVTDIPELPIVKGHTVTWSETDFTNVTAPKTVHLVKTANKYKIYLNATSAGKLPTNQKSEIEVTYGEKVPVVLNAVHNDSENYAFSGWYDANGKYVNLTNMVYEIEGDLTLEARYFYAWIGPY